MSDIGFMDVVKSIFEKIVDKKDDDKHDIQITITNTTTGGDISSHRHATDGKTIKHPAKAGSKKGRKARTENGYSPSPQQQYRPPQQRSESKRKANGGDVTLEAIQLYSTGIKGKVYTTTFYKSINHNFGVEVTIKNSTNRPQPVQIGLCVYDQNDNPVHNFKGNSTFTVKANYTAVQPIFADAKAFARMKAGTYKYQIWVNNQPILKDYFIIAYKP